MRGAWWVVGILCFLSFESTFAGVSQSKVLSSYAEQLLKCKDAALDLAPNETDSKEVARAKNLLRFATKLPGVSNFVNCAGSGVATQKAKKADILEPQVLIETPDIGQDFLELLIAFLIVPILLLLLTSPASLVAFRNRLKREVVGSSEILVNLDGLPKAVSHWPEWKGVEFQRQHHSAHLLPLPDFLSVARNHARAQGLEISYEDLQSLMSIVPPQAYVNNRAYEILEDALWDAKQRHEHAQEEEFWESKLVENESKTRAAFTRATLTDTLSDVSPVKVDILDRVLANSGADKRLSLNIDHAKFLEKIARWGETEPTSSCTSHHELTGLCSDYADLVKSTALLRYAAQLIRAQINPQQMVYGDDIIRANPVAHDKMRRVKEAKAVALMKFVAIFALLAVLAVLLAVLVIKRVPEPKNRGDCGPAFVPSAPSVRGLDVTHVWVQWSLPRRCEVVEAVLVTQPATEVLYLGNNTAQVTLSPNVPYTFWVSMLVKGQSTPNIGLPIQWTLADGH